MTTPYLELNWAVTLKTTKLVWEGKQRSGQKRVATYSKTSAESRVSYAGIFA